ncbi:MAG: hypothetical protein JWQ83_508 [Lacunisphaera sp.]|nr:hypothetical protein [Lacunisphaera sp.]
MSDEKTTGVPASPAKKQPTGSTPPVPPPPPPPPAVNSPGSTPSTPPVPGAPAVAPQPVIEYALPTQRKSWLPSPALIRNLGCLFKLLVGLTVLLCLGYFALVAMNPKARKWATQGAKDGSGGPTPFKVVNQILAIPAQAIGKTKDVVAASDARVGVLNNVISEEEAKTAGQRGKAGPAVDPFAAANAILNGNPAPAGGANAKPTLGVGTTTSDGPQAISAAALLAMSDKNPPSDPSTTTAPILPAEVPKPPEPIAPTQVKLPGGIIISSASPEGTPAASQPFLFWVVNLNISGVFQSNPPRILMNNHLVYENQEVSAPLGITFVRIDPVKKLILFRNKSGAEVTRSY